MDSSRLVNVFRVPLPGIPSRGDVGELLDPGPEKALFLERGRPAPESTHPCSTQKGRFQQPPISNLQVAQEIEPLRSVTMAGGSSMNQGFTYREVLPRLPHGATLLGYLSQRYRHSSVAAWEQRIRLGQVTLEGRPATPTTPVLRGQAVAWHRPPWREPDAPLAVSTLYEDRSAPRRGQARRPADPAGRGLPRAHLARSGQAARSPGGTGPSVGAVDVGHRPLRPDGRGSLRSHGGVAPRCGPQVLPGSRERSTLPSELHDRRPHRARTAPSAAHDSWGVRERKDRPEPGHGRRAARERFRCRRRDRYRTAAPDSHSPGRRRAPAGGRPPVSLRRLSGRRLPGATRRPRIPPSRRRASRSPPARCAGTARPLPPPANPAVSKSCVTDSTFSVYIPRECRKSRGIDPEACVANPRGHT